MNKMYFTVRPDDEKHLVRPKKPLVEDNSDEPLKCITTVVREGTSVYVGDAKRVFVRVNKRDDGEHVLKITYE